MSVVELDATGGHWFVASAVGRSDVFSSGALDWRSENWVEQPLSAVLGDGSGGSASAAHLLPAEPRKVVGEGV